MVNRKYLKTILWIFFGLLCVGTIGYMLLLHIGFINALYMTVITISTVGYKEVAIMTPAAKVFSIFLILFGVGTVGYTFTTVLVMFIEGTIRDIWRDRKMENKIQELHQHYILCGLGESGKTIIKDFIRHKADFVIIEEDAEKCERIRREGLLVIEGDATDEEVLHRAGVKRANGVVCTLSTDVDNIVAVLTVRGLNPDIYIISRAIDESAHEKLRKVGANKTISINEIGGKRMAGMILRPHIISFLDVITRVGDMELDLEEVTVHEGSPLAKKTLREAEIPQKTGLIVLAVNDQIKKKMIFNPSGNYTIEPNDILIVLGREEQVDALLELEKSKGE
ncbi:MAG: potassium channel protein [Tissierellia bacterium]|nr:potassium channel protein [Tissierellia bacterium]